MEQLDNKKCVLPVLLDLSASFETIDHTVLLERLTTSVGLCGEALKWFSSYLSCRYQAVLSNNDKSGERHIRNGVPQGSVLAPILFTIYTMLLGPLLKSREVDYHFYSDDTQTYFSCNLDKIGYGDLY